MPRRGLKGKGWDISTRNGRGTTRTNQTSQNFVLWLSVSILPPTSQNCVLSLPEHSSTGLYRNTETLKLRCCPPVLTPDRMYVKRRAAVKEGNALSPAGAGDAICSIVRLSPMRLYPRHRSLLLVPQKIYLHMRHRALLLVPRTHLSAPRAPAAHASCPAVMNAIALILRLQVCSGKQKWGCGAQGGCEPGSRQRVGPIRASVMEMSDSDSDSIPADNIPAQEPNKSHDSDGGSDGSSVGGSVVLLIGANPIHHRR